MGRKLGVLLVRGSPTATGRARRLRGVSRWEPAGSEQRAETKWWRASHGGLVLRQIACRVWAVTAEWWKLVLETAELEVLELLVVLVELEELLWQRVLAMVW